MTPPEPVRVLVSVGCGFCMTEHHTNCRPEIVHFEKVFVCACGERDHKPIPLTKGSKKDKLDT